jgi:hypothetical protein
MKLISELHDPLHNPLGLVVEGEGVDKKHYLTGLFLEFDSKNKNGRVYRSEWHDPCVHKYIEEKMIPGRGWSELDHPDGATISLKNVCARVVEMHKEGSNWFGKSIITNTPLGQTVRGLLESGGTLGSSSRGVGSLKQIEESIMEVQSDYRIITPSDLVSDPSAHGALMRGIMEGQEYFWDDTLGFYSEVTKKKINKMTVEQIEAKKIAIFENFIKEISGGTYLQYK